MTPTLYALCTISLIMFIEQVQVLWLIMEQLTQCGACCWAALCWCIHEGTTHTILSAWVRQVCSHCGVWFVRPAISPQCIVSPHLTLCWKKMKYPIKPASFCSLCEYIVVIISCLCWCSFVNDRKLSTWHYLVFCYVVYTCFFISFIMFILSYMV